MPGIVGLFFLLIEPFARLYFQGSATGEKAVTNAAGGGIDPE